MDRHRRWRLANPEKVRAYNAHFNALHRFDKRLVLDEMKSGPCSDCGVTFPPECMDFDHLNGDKIESVSNLLRDRGIKAARAESAKCDLVCANCHRIRTRKRAKDGKANHIAA